MEKTNQQPSPPGSPRTPHPSLDDTQTIEIQHRLADLAVDEKRADFEMGVCCSKTSFKAIRYLTQIAALFILMTFAIVRITTMDPDEDISIYINLLSTCVGILLPSPSVQ